MEPWLKSLIATACVVVIGWGGYLGWMEFQRRAYIAAAAQSAKDLEAIQNEQKQKADAQYADWLKQQELLNIRSRCHDLANQMRDYNVIAAPKGAMPKDQLVAEIKKCASEDKLSADDRVDMQPYL